MTGIQPTSRFAQKAAPEHGVGIGKEDGVELGLLGQLGEHDLVVDVVDEGGRVVECLPAGVVSPDVWKIKFRRICLTK